MHVISGVRPSARQSCVRFPSLLVGPSGLCLLGRDETGHTPTHPPCICQSINVSRVCRNGLLMMLFPQSPVPEELLHSLTAEHLISLKEKCLPAIAGGPDANAAYLEVPA